MHSRPSVSVAICTRDRPELLRRCLTAVARCAGVAEVLVVDNNSADGERTRRIAEEYGATYVLEPITGLQFARNRAITAASSEVIAFTDDDSEPDAGWVDAIAAAFRDPTVAGVTGKTLPAQPMNRVQAAFDALRRPWPDLPITIGPDAVRRFWYRGVTGVGANMAFRHDFLVGQGGFPGSIYPADDDHMMIAVLLSGGRLCYRPDAVVVQSHRSQFHEAGARMFEYGTCASRMIWFVGRSRNSLGLAAFNQAWLLLQNVRQTFIALVRARPLQFVLRSAYTCGLVLGLVTPRRPATGVPVKQTNFTSAARGNPAASLLRR